MKTVKSKPIIPWIGGKRRLAKRLIPLFPAHTCYVEPFCGAAALFFIKEPAKVEIINDVNSELFNIYRVVKYHFDEFVRQLEWTLISREMFLCQQIIPPETLTDIQRAARFFFLQKLAFGGRVENQSFGADATRPPKMNLLRIKDILSAAHHRLGRTTIEHLDWSECIRKYDRPHTLFYCDPPYFGTEGYGVDFDLEQYARMADMARSIQGRMIISVNDIPEMRQAFDGLTIEHVNISYTVGGASVKSKKWGELIIRNW